MAVGHREAWGEDTMVFAAVEVSVAEEAEDVEEDGTTTMATTEAQDELATRSLRKSPCPTTTAALTRAAVVTGGIDN